jgi:zinc transport system substrate-binding protein
MFSQELIASANNPDLTVVNIDVKVGENTNWMTPPVQLEATSKIATALSQIDPEHSSAYQESAEEYGDKIAATEAEMKAKLAQLSLSNVNVMCADQLVGFVKWVGFNIITSFGRPDSLTPLVVRELVDKGKAEDVTLIIDNLQSGQDAGAGIAEELGISRIILSNFPGGFTNTETWEKAIDHNIELILEAVAQ